MAIGLIWEAPEAQLFVFSSALTISGVVPMYDTITGGTKTDYTGRCKDLSIRGLERDISAESTLGVNQIAHQKRPSAVEASFTIIHQENIGSQFLAGIATTLTSTLVTAAADFNQYQYGEKSTAAAKRVAGAIAFILDNQELLTSSDKKLVVAVLNNAYCTSRELSLDSEGFVEEKLTFKCMPQDYRDEDNFTGTY